METTNQQRKRSDSVVSPFGAKTSFLNTTTLNSSAATFQPVRPASEEKPKQPTPSAPGVGK